MRVFNMAALAALVIVSGCGLAPGGGQIEAAAVTAIDKGRSEVKAFNDTKAEVYMDLPCAVSLGAYYRLDNAVKQKGLRLLCSGKDDGVPDEPL